jgi:RNA polymerase sigma-70 factor (ECF subfamily)
MHEITDLLKALSKGDKQALDKLLPLVDEELKKIARPYMRNERPGNLLQTTALVNEALIKLIREDISYENRKHFYALVAKRMRQVLVDYARKAPRAEFIDVDEAVIPDTRRSKEVLELDQALTEFAKKYERAAMVVECRYFIGLTLKEVAEVLDISQKTVERDWEFALAWLKKYMKGESSDLNAGQL